MAFPVRPAAMALAALAMGTAARADDAATEVAGVIVTASRDGAYQADRSSAATRTDTPLRDVPQSVSVITDRLIKDQAMQGMGDLLRYVPGATMGQGEGHRDAPTLRGNASTADFFVDGVRDDVQYIRDLYNVERVEVLKGPNAMIFGRGGGGGVINRVTKVADGISSRTISAELGSWSHRRFAGDLDSNFRHDLAGRVVTVFESSGSFRDHVDLQRWGVTPSLRWRPSDDVTLVLSYEHFQDQRTVDRGVPSFNGRPAPAARRVFFGDPDFSRAATRVDRLSALTQYAPSETLTLRNRTVFGVYDKYYQNSYAAGAARAGVTGAPATAPLQAYSTDNDRRNLFNQSDLVWNFKAGSIEHTLLAGVELGRQVSDNRRRTGFYAGGASQILVPFPSPTLRNSGITLLATPSDANNHVRVNLAAGYLQDQIELSQHLQVVAGLRYDRVDIAFHDNRLSATRRDLGRTDDLWSPRLGLVLKPSTSVSVYGSYSVSWLPSAGDQFGALTATNQAFRPEKFENLELGGKWEITPDLFLTGAIYRLDRDNTTAPDPSTPGRTVLTGAQRTKGLEFGLSGKITSRWSLMGGYALQKAEIRRATSACPAGGCEAALTPRRTFSLWNRYDVTDRIGAGVGIVAQSRMYAAVDNTVTLPGFTRVDAALFLRLTDNLRGQVNVQNLFDRRTFPTSHGNDNILPGAPRTVRVGLTADF
jgi:catecholate siderophore receptor